jgi:hypothetical protein
VDAIVRAAGAAQVERNGRAGNGFEASGADGVFDPLVEQLEEHVVEAGVEDSSQAVARAVKGVD